MGSRGALLQTGRTPEGRLGASGLCAISLDGGSDSGPSITDTKDRPDEGGTRTLKLEYSTEEFRLDQGEKWDHSCTRRMSANRGIDWFTAEAFLKVGEEPEFEVMWQPSEHWPCNEGRPNRAYNHTKSGAQDWETDA